MSIHLKQLNPYPIKKQRTKLEATIYSTTRRARFQVYNNVASGSTRSNAHQLLESGNIKAMKPKEAFMAMSSEGFILVDVRPIWEREKARVKGSLHIPLFVEDVDNSLITLIKKWVHFGYIGLWTGQYLTTLNPDFLFQVETAVPSKDTKLLVACGEGLRSLIAVSKLYDGGYRNLGWLVGGFNRASDTDFPAVEGKEKLQYATVGGVSYYFLKLLVLLRAVGNKDKS